MKALIFAIALAAAGFVGYRYLAAREPVAPSAKEAPASAGPTASAPPPAEASFIVTRAETVPISFDFNGTAAPSRLVEVRARIKGFLNSRKFEEGSLVKQGDLLYEIDPRAFQADLQIQRAQVEQAKAHAEMTRRESGRLDKLFTDKIISQSEADKQRAALTEADAAVKLAQANLDKAQLEMSYTRIEAPLTGLIQKTFKETGSLVDETENSLLTEILQVDPIYIGFPMSESQFARIKEGLNSGELQRAGEGEPHIELTLVGGEAYPLRGEINFQDPSIDTQTGAVRYRAEVANPDGKLKPGQFVQVRLKGLVRPDTIAVPQQTVNQSPTGAFIYVIGPDDKLESRKVTLSEWSGGDWIVASGLQSGERILTSGSSKLQPGMAVAPKPATAAAETTATAIIPGRGAQ